jgi:hypothetical protein
MELASFYNLNPTEVHINYKNVIYHLNFMINLFICIYFGGGGVNFINIFMGGGRKL